MPRDPSFLSPLGRRLRQVVPELGAEGGLEPPLLTHVSVQFGPVEEISS